MACGATGIALLSGLSASQSLPTVDLGYAIHQANFLNASLSSRPLLNQKLTIAVYWRLLQLLEHQIWPATCWRSEIPRSSPPNRQKNHR